MPEKLEKKRNNPTPIVNKRNQKKTNLNANTDFDPLLHPTSTKVSANTYWGEKTKRN